MPETVLITGASSGIGLQLAHLFAADRSALVLVARRREQLDALAVELRQAHGVEVRVLVKDLSAAGAAGEIEAELNAAGVEVDVVVNNAGFGVRGPVVETPLDRLMAMVQVNLTALVELTRRFLPGMIARRRGGVLNVGSTAGFQPGPHLAVYYATKAFVLSFSEALSEELAGSGVSVTLLAPGPTDTGFQAEAHMKDALLFKLGAMTAASVARAGYRGFRRRRLLVVPGVLNRLGATSVRFAPRLLVRKITKRLNADL
jgi:hypothetical protein